MPTRPIETDVQLPLWIVADATPSALRLRDNPLDRAVYSRGRVFGLRVATGELVEYIRCQHCGELQEARRWNFAPDERNKSGFEHVCRQCRNQQRNTDERRSYMRDYMRRYRGGRRQDLAAPTPA